MTSPFKNQFIQTLNPETSLTDVTNFFIFEMQEKASLSSCKLA